MKGSGRVEEEVTACVKPCGVTAQPQGDSKLVLVQVLSRSWSRGLGEARGGSR